MKKQLLFFFLFSISTSILLAQVPFTSVPGSTMTINGELKTIGNTIVGLNETINGVTYTPNDNYNGNISNDQRTFDYIDIDNDQDTFSSSSAEFTSNGPCAKVVYAGLYWAASYFVERNEDNANNIQYADLPFPDNRPDFRTLKFKPPGVTDYIDILPSDTQIIFDGYRNTPTNPEDSAVKDIPYVCYADVTSIVNELPSLDGTYTVANMRASTGFSGNNTNGISGGWVLVIAYEDNSLSKKYISSQQGFINNQLCDPAADPTCLKSFTYNGFKTARKRAPVRARCAVATLEGDKSSSGDVFQIERQDLTRRNLGNHSSYAVNSYNNFFDSSISEDNSYVTNRTPSSKNTLGFDLDIFDISNNNNETIGNNQTFATFFTSSTSDEYSIFFSSFQLEITEPELLVTDRVFDVNGIDITGESVNFGDQLFLELTIENKGVEDITNASIKDILPDNVDFTLGSIITSHPGIVVTPSSTNREINITIADDLLVEDERGRAHTIRFGVQVTSKCDSCSNEINNLVTYTCTGVASGITNTGESMQDKSIPVFVCSNDYNIEEQELTAPAGFTKYTWTDVYNPRTTYPNAQTITVDNTGKYTVLSTGAPGCQDSRQTFIVDSYRSVGHPVSEQFLNDLGANPNVHGEYNECYENESSFEFPKLYLCGAETTLNVPLGFPAGTTVSIERLDPAACPSVIRDRRCPIPNIDSGECEGDWVQVSTDVGSYTVEQAGEYRIMATFIGDCTLPFYFRVHQNNYDLDLVVVEEIACDSPGTLRVENSLHQYEYQLIPGSGTALPYQDSPEFTGLTVAGMYTVNARRFGSRPFECVLQKSIFLQEAEELIMDITIQPANQQGLGEIEINASGGVPPYSYSINNASPVSTNVFTNLIAGNYGITVQDAKGCTFEKLVAITEELTVELNLENTDISCFSEATAAIDSNVSGSSGVYTYTLTGTNFLGSSITVGPKEDGLFNNLFAGSYLYKVESVGAAPIYIPFIVSQTSQLIADAFADPIGCNGDQDGKISVSVTTGGTSPYFFSLYTNSNDVVYSSIADDEDGMLGKHTFENLPADVYRVEVKDSKGCPVSINDLIITEPSPLILNIVTEPLTTDSDAQIEVTASGGNATYMYELIDATTSAVVIPAQTSNIFTLGTPGNYSVKVQDIINGCEVLQEVTIVPIEEVPLIKYADEILFCAATGQRYPVVSIDDQDGEDLEVSFIEEASIVWQKLDDISCTITSENDCPTTDLSCSSNWSDMDTGAKINIKEEGEYRVVVTFANRTTNNTEIYYFKAENNFSNPAESFAMYPNPTTSIVQTNQKVKSIEVFDVMGKMVLQTSESTYDVASLTNGIYFVKVVTNYDDEIFTRLVKN